MTTQLVFILLQLADFVTTMIALNMGGGEDNPLVSRLMVIGSLQGLILSKVIILAFAAAVVLARKPRVLRWATFAFAGVVLWNLVVIARLAFRSHGV